MITLKLKQVSVYDFRAISVSIFVLVALLISVASLSKALAYTQITSQLDFGARGYNVTNLQTFYAANPSIYPEGLVTGYFGVLTRTATQRFQALYGFEQVGRVGPLTLAKINSLIAQGGWVAVDMTGPAFFNMTQTKGNNSATFAFTTDENTTAKVVYGTSPLMFNEGDINSNGFGPIGGTTVSSSNGMATSHSITLSNLQTSTVYYYTVITTDSTGNVSAYGPNLSFRAN